jgi:hypothetical protein
MPDVGPEHGPPWPNGAACALAGGGKGICKNNACAACVDPTDDGLCNAAYGPGNICVSGACAPGTCHTSQQCGDQKLCDTATHTCVACSADAACKTDVVYGAQTLCIAGKCLVGNCHDKNSDCRQGQICGLSVPHACAACTTDAQCDTRFMNGTICVEGACVVGDCRASSDCTAAKDGLICGVKTANTCGKCTNDAQCQADTRYKNTRNLCKTTAGANNGECLTNSLHQQRPGLRRQHRRLLLQQQVRARQLLRRQRLQPDGRQLHLQQQHLHPVRAGRGQPVLRRSGERQRQHRHRQRQGRRRGHGQVRVPHPHPGHALDRGQPALGHHHHHRGRDHRAPPTSTAWRPAARPRRPRRPWSRCRVNVKITTSKGPIRWRLPKDAIALRFVGNNSSLIPADGARLTIDGTGDTSGSGVVFNLDSAGGKATIENVTIQNTGLDGVQVLKGTGVVGPGVTISDAGTTTNRQSGLLVTAGAPRSAAATAPTTPSSRTTRSTASASPVPAR